MPINTSLLVASPTLQDYLVDNATGTAMANGTITLYKDTQRQLFKNWYSQSGSPGNYTYVPLPNPLTLSGIGTIADMNGNDVIPFFYPYSETDNATVEKYYIVVKNANGQSQFTRADFPFLNVEEANTGLSTLNNLIVNGQFWRNLGTINVSTVTATTPEMLCPSQHDGFSLPDIQFIKDAAGGSTDIATFAAFPPGTFLNPIDSTLPNQDVTPEYYLNMQCTVSGANTYKIVQIPLSLHVKNLESTEVTFTIWARGNGIITLSYLQFLGTGVSSPSAFLIETLTLESDWEKFSTIFTLPPAAGPLGAGADDAFYIQISYPINTTFSIDIAKPCLYIGNTTPSNEYYNYDQINAIISSPRTGDIKHSINYLNSNSINYIPGGWLPFNGTLIGSPSSGATYAKADSWQLYNLLWNSIADIYCPVVNSTLPVASIGRGASAYADFSANHCLVLPQSLGRVLSGASIGNVTYSKVWTRHPSMANEILVNDTSPFYTGTPVKFFAQSGGLPSPLSSFTTYYLIVIDGTTLQVATNLVSAIQGIEITSIATSLVKQYFTATIGPYPLGSYDGEDDHALIGLENAIHTHNQNTSFDSGSNTAILGNVNPGTTVVGIASNINQQGNSQPHNTLQPTLYVNYLIKL